MSPKLKPDARSIAAHVLDRVRGEGAFAAAVLDAALERYPELDPRERALATDLAYGSLRAGPYIEARLAKHASRGIEKLDPLVLSRLTVAAYQILFLDRVPAFAAVSEGVSAVTEVRGPKLGAFANAVLRRLSEEAPADKRALLETATRESVAPWLRDALVRALGREGADAFVLSLASPPLNFRVRVGEDRAALLERLRLAVPGAEIEAGKVSPLAIRVRGGGDPKRLSLVREGRLVAQEEGAQFIAMALGSRAGESVLDACAGRGNKTALLAELVGPRGAVDAADQHPQKLARLRAALADLGLAPRATFAVDWSVGAGDVPAGYDRVLVDAPCSGIGTLRRRPDLATRKDSAALVELAALQVELLLRAAERAKVGGAVLYAVCSLLREEAEDVVDAALARAPFLRLAPFPAEAARTIAGESPTLRLTPAEHQTDGYFLASFVRR
jgi:16S rRNA (cytosine967-C5)-methyltransferase